MKYTSGSTRYSDEERFGSSAYFSLAEGTLEYETSEEGGYIYYSSITVTLYTVIGGNLETMTIPEDAF